MTIFEKIIAGQIPCYKLAEDEHFIAFLDIAPATDGHALIVPKIAIDRLFDLPTETLAKLLPFAQKVANAIQKAFPCDRVNILTLGFEVPHAHMHLIPMNNMADAEILANKKMATKETLLAVQQQIVACL